MSPGILDGLRANSVGCKFSESASRVMAKPSRPVEPRTRISLAEDMILRVLVQEICG